MSLLAGRDRSSPSRRRMPRGVTVLLLSALLFVGGGAGAVIITNNATFQAQPPCGSYGYGGYGGYCWPPPGQPPGPNALCQTRPVAAPLLKQATHSKQPRAPRAEGWHA